MTLFRFMFKLRAVLMSSTGGPSGDWDAGNSSTADKWDTGNNGAADSWDAGNAGATGSWDAGNAGEANSWDAGNSGKTTRNGGKNALTNDDISKHENDHEHTDRPHRGGECFNCGEEGHSKAECPNPRAFTGNCRICDKQGHPAAQCPDKGPVVCRNCKKDGHIAKDCKDNRVLDYSAIPDEEPEEAWQHLVEADQAQDLDDIRMVCRVRI